MYLMKVHNAGHMVPMDQPKASLEMITRFMKGMPLDGDHPVTHTITDSSDAITDSSTLMVSGYILS